MPDGLLKLRQQNTAKLEPAQQFQRGYLTRVDGSVKVAGREGYVWVRDPAGSVQQVFNGKVTDIANLPVKLAPMRGQGEDLMVADVDWQNIVYSKQYDGNPYYKQHAISHEWRGGFPGPDAITVYPSAWGELRTAPYSGLSIHVSGMLYFYQDAPTSFPGGTFDLSSYQPDSGSALLVGIGLNKTTNAITAVAGSTIADSDLVLPPIPARGDNVILSAYVRLDGDATAISWTDITNARTFINDRGGDAFNEVVLESILFDLTPTQAMEEGRLQWDADNGTLQLGLPGGTSILQLGQELQFRAKCDEVGGIADGQAVYVSDATGGNPLIKVANSNDYAIASRVFGVATEAISYNQFGYVTFFGIVRDIDTSGLTEGQPVYLDTDGTLTNTAPAAPAARVFVGITLRQHATEGVMGVNPRTNQRIEDLSQVNAASPAAGDVLQWDDTNGYWDAKPVGDAVGYSRHFQHMGA
jgi:hypothetical protein